MRRLGFSLFLLATYGCYVQAQRIDTLYYYQGAPTGSEKLSYGRMYACTRFTPRDYVVRVQQIEFLVTDISEGATCTLSILDDSAGEPSGWLYGPMPYEITQTGWQRIDVSAQNLLFHYDFYVAVGFDQNSSPRIACEYDEPWSLRTYDMDCCGWSLVDNTDLFIRTTVQSLYTSVQSEKTTDDRLSLRLFPNPFNQSLTVRCNAGTPASRIIVHNALGQRVAELGTFTSGGGLQEIHWDGTDDAGNLLNSGIYFISCTDGRKSMTEKILLAR